MRQPKNTDQTFFFSNFFSQEHSYSKFSSNHVITITNPNFLLSFRIRARNHQEHPTNQTGETTTDPNHTSQQQPFSFSDLYHSKPPPPFKFKRNRNRREEEHLNQNRTAQRGKKVFFFSLSSLDLGLLVVYF